MPKILVADDSITVRKVAERLLTEAGMEVALAASGEEAMAYLSTEHPDFVISDVIMPDKSGYDVCRFVRSHHSLADTPVLLISGIVNEEVNRQAESCRANGVLKKPFQGTSLQERVREMLAKQSEQVPEPQQSPPVGPMEAAAASESPSSNSGTPTPKAYRITEEQLRSFREASGRIKELETMLEEEKARSSKLLEQVSSVEDSNRIAELERKLSTSNERIDELMDQLQRQTDLERRNQELEATVADLRERMAQAPGTGEQTSHATVSDLQALLADQQKRLAELAEEVLRHGQASDQMKQLEATLAAEQQRAAELATRCGDFEQQLTKERARVEELVGLLAKISRLADAGQELRSSAVEY